jgi:quinohemoprotein ethanol dehydrogenase
MFKRVWIFVLLIVFIVAGCGGNNTAPNKKQKNAAKNTNYSAVQHMKYKGKVAPNFNSDDLTAPPSGNWVTNGGNI